jgi:hypothetical protein
MAGPSYVELFDDHGVSFVSVTQQFNTTTSMGRLTLKKVSKCRQRPNTVADDLLLVTASWASGGLLGWWRRRRRRPEHPAQSVHVVCGAVASLGCDAALSNTN